MERAQRPVLHQPAARAVHGLVEVAGARRLRQARPRDARRAQARPAAGRRRARRPEERAQVRHLDLRVLRRPARRRRLQRRRLRPAPVLQARRRRRRPRRGGQPRGRPRPARRARRASRSGSPRAASAARTSATSARPATRRIRADCQALNVSLRRWNDDPRVDAVFQYTFRDDPVFPVGLADAKLTQGVAGLRPVQGVGRRPQARRPGARAAGRLQGLTRGMGGSVYDERPWLARYAEGQPADIEPDHPSALAMFDATVRRAPDAVAIHYRDSALTLRRARRALRRLRRRPRAARRRARRPRRRVPAERPGVRRRRARGVEGSGPSRCRSTRCSRSARCARCSRTASRWRSSRSSRCGRTSRARPSPTTLGAHRRHRGAGATSSRVEPRRAGAAGSRARDPTTSPS